MNCKVVIAETSERLNIPQENLLTPDYLRQLCFENLPDVDAAKIAERLASLGARKWQIDELNVPLAEAIQNAPNFVEDKADG
jgi:ribonuclease D